ncbi:hypothetical protein ACFC3F_01170 [Microbacterium sp. NPDC055910]|uniref:hypothetical protein n=1 Tax=Microbacterium sp. NPDC055910 TaxID=3345659 RepID=UPI0035DA42E2
MTPTRRDLDRNRILTSDEALTDQLGLLLERAINPRQLWLLFLDAGDRLTDSIMPCDDYPQDPDEIVRVPDLGHVTNASVLAAHLGDLCTWTDAASVVLVWERPGPPEFGSDELRWARAMSDACRHAEVPLRGQFRLHDDGVRILTPDDYLGEAAIAV